MTQQLSTFSRPPEVDESNSKQCSMLKLKKITVERNQKPDSTSAVSTTSFYCRKLIHKTFALLVFLM